MKRLAWAAVLPLLVLVGCHLFRPARLVPPSEGMPELKPALIDYFDSDAFDNQFEAHLVSKEPAIIIRTESARPEWQGRLNAWIAAWNRGGSSRARTVRGQVPLPGVKIDSDSIREFRELVGDLLDRTEQAAHTGASWYVNERQRSKRVALLKPYSLRFHRDGDSPIHLVFFHGEYAAYYPHFIRSLMREPEREDEEWTRTVECSHCLLAHRPGIAQLARRAR